MTNADMIINYIKGLHSTQIALPSGYYFFDSAETEPQKNMFAYTVPFYKKYYSDYNKRYLILGSSPSRKSTALTDVPFETPQHLSYLLGLNRSTYKTPNDGAGFLYDIMEQYGGCDCFYSDFYMGFLFPRCICRNNEKGNTINCNFYENSELLSAVYGYVVASIKAQLSFHIDASICYCIGTGENYKILSAPNMQYHFFGNILPLEHPRFIMQYNRGKKDYYAEKYLSSLKNRQKNSL